MASPPPHPDLCDQLAELQDRLYDIVVTSIAQPLRSDSARRLRRDAQEAAALAESLADVALQLAS